MKLPEWLDARLILTEPAQDKEQAIDALVALLAAQRKLQHPLRFRAALLQREAEFAAELSPDIAIPHLQSDEVRESTIAAAQTLDGRTVFLLASRNEKEHLQQLAKLAAALSEEAPPRQ